MTSYCLGCHRSYPDLGPDATPEAIRGQHDPACPVARGGVWECDCTGPYCDEYCAGGWRMPDGSLVQPADCAKS